MDSRADIYSLGVVFYEMLTGELPGKCLEPPSRKVRLDVRLDQVVLRALEQTPELRYQQVSEVKTMVETIASSGASATATVAPVAPVVSSDALSPGTDTNKSPYLRILELLSGLTFTSPLAVKLANISAAGFLGFLAFLGFLPLPGMQRCFGFSGFYGFFGLIGLAVAVEYAHRRKVARTGKAGELAARGLVWRVVGAALAIVLAVAVALAVALGFFGDNQPPWRIPGAPPPSASAVEPALTFGPVIERVLSDIAAKRGSEALQLGSGQLRSLPGSARPVDSRHEWLRSSQTDVLLDFAANHRLVVLEGLKLADCPEDFWDSATPGDLAAALQTEAQGFSHEATSGAGDYWLTENPRFPVTLVFETSRGARGLLQLAGLTENPPGMKLRYKLVLAPVLGRTPAAPPVSDKSALTWLLEQKPTLAPAGKDLTSAPSLPLPSEAVGFADWTGRFHPVMFLAWPKPRSGFETLAEGYLVFSNDIANLQVFRGTNALAAANHFLGEFQITPTPAHASLSVGFRLTPAGQLYLDVSGADKRVALVGSRARFAHPAKLAQTRGPADSASPALLAESPKLQFLAWQDEWKANLSGEARVWHPDGSPVTDATERKWLGRVHAPPMDVSSLRLSSEPRFLHLWFSHPIFDQCGETEVTLLDERDEVIPLGAHGSVSGASAAADPENGDLGWFTTTLSSGAGPNLPSRITVRLRYTVGSLEKTQEIPVAPNSRTAMTLEGGSLLNGVGQNVDGKAFVTIAVDANKLGARRFGVVAVTKAGRRLTARGSWSGNPDLYVEEFDVDAPLADVAHFIIGTRPIRVMAWKNVVLPRD